MPCDKHFDCSACAEADKGWDDVVAASARDAERWRFILSTPQNVASFANLFALHAKGGDKNSIENMEAWVDRLMLAEATRAKHGDFLR